MIRIRDEYNSLPVNILEPPVQEYVEHYFNTQFLRPFTENPHLQTKRGNGLLYPSYGDLPKPKINELVIPTGATRWAYTVVACDRPTKEDIYNTAAENANRLILEFGAHRLWDDTLSIPAGGNGEVWPCRMVMIPLQPHPVKPAELDNDRDPVYDDPNDPWGLWLIPFVDARYFWQFHDVAAITEQVKEYTDPLSIVNFVAGRLDADIKVYDTTNSATQNVHTNYAAALPDVAGNDYENAAVVLDSVFWHLGLTLVPDMQAMGSTLSPVNAEKWLGVGMALTEDMYQQNLEGKLYNMRTGGTASLTDNGMPVRSFGGSLLTSAVKWQPDIIQIPDGEGDWISTLSIAGTTEPNTELRMRTKYKDPVDNDLAYQLSDDYYARFNRSYNFTFAATQNWQPTGYDDYVIHYQKIREHKGVRAAQAFTRIRSWQGNLFPVAYESATSEFSTIIFRPLDVCAGIGFACDCVLAEVITAGCGSNLNPGDEVQVWDLTQDNFLMPPALLFNSIGFARYYKIQETEYNRPPGLTGDCRWVVEKMSCVEQSL